MRIRQRTLIAIVAVFPFVPLFAQDHSSDKAKQVVDAAIAGLGGDHFLRMQTRMASGRIYSFFHDQMSGLDRATIYTEYLSPPPANGLAIRERELLGKKGDYSYLFLPDQGWDITFRGARQVPDENWQRYRRTTQNDILYLLRTRRNEASMEFDYVSNEVYLSRHVDIIDITDKSGQTIRVYFDFNTRLPVREIYTWFDPVLKERNEEVSVYDKYRDIGQGIQWPYSIERERNGYKAYQLFAEKVEANVATPPKTFDLPPGVKMLKKVD
jgi:hypothetical protein